MLSSASVGNAYISRPESIVRFMAEMSVEK